MNEDSKRIRNKIAKTRLQLRSDDLTEEEKMQLYKQEKNLERELFYVRTVETYRNKVYKKMEMINDEKHKGR